MALAAIVVALGVVLLLAASNAAAAAGDISTVAGTGSAGYSGDGGAATSAQLSQPTGVAIGPSGELYVADTTNHRVRKIAGGTITTVAGTGMSGYSGDGGSATAARLNTPTDVAVDSQGRLYIADYGNHAVRRVSTGGAITTVAGTGQAGFTGDGGAATAARLRNPAGLTLTAGDELVIGDSGNNRVRKVSGAGTITTVAGTGTAGYLGDGGQATLARLNSPADAVTDASGNLYIADDGNHRVRKVTVGGTITTVAGTGTASSTGDGGPATAASLNRPVGVDVDSTGALYIAEYAGHRIRRVASSGTITTVAGTGSAGYSGDGGPATAAGLSWPVRATLASGGDFYVPELGSNRVRRVEGLGAPQSPALTAAVPASPANDNSPRVTGTAEPGTTVRLYTNSTCTSQVAASGSAEQLASPGLTVTVPDNSSTTFWATTTTIEGTSSGCSQSSVTYVEDSAPPPAPSIQSAPASPNPDPTPAWSFSGQTGATFECRLERGGATVSDWASCTSPTSYDLGGEPDASYTFLVRARDAAGNVGSAATSAYELDRTLPGKPAIDSAPPATGSSRTPAWSFSGEPGVTFECRLARGGTVVSGWTACTSPESFDLAGEPDAGYTFSVRAVGAGGTGPQADGAYMLDTVAPGAPSIDSAPVSPTALTAAAWEFSGEPGASFECRLAHESAVVSSWAPCESPKAYELSGHPDGSYEFAVRAVDTAGNTGAAATSSLVLARAGDPAPGGGEPAPADGGADPPAADDSPLPPPAGDDDEPPAAPPSAQAKLDPNSYIPQRSIAMRTPGRVPVKVRCPETPDGEGVCRGVVKLHLVKRARGEQVVSARRGGATRPRGKRLKIGRGRFRVKAGERTVVKVRVARRARRRLVRKRKRRRCRVTVRLKAADGTKRTVRKEMPLTFRFRRSGGRKGRTR